MTSTLEYVDICAGLCWGDEAKGKVVSQLAKSGNYDMVCRWNGGNNAGHTVYVKGTKYKTHLIPSGIFYDIPCIIGPDCVIHQESFMEELSYLDQHGFDTTLIKVSPKAHIITDKHVEEDKKHYQSQGTTSKGIAPCYRDKYARIGIQAKDVPFFEPFLWNESLEGRILCEGAQGFWLDINQGNYPYTTSSVTLPYGACSLGFSPKRIRRIYGCSKIYDTRAGTDPLFPETLLEDPELRSIIEHGKEFGTTTGRMRKVNWLNLDKLIQAIQISGTTYLILSKLDVLETVQLFKLFHHNQLHSFDTMEQMKDYINNILSKECSELEEILYSNDPEKVPDL
jgi:adenylosuccinate synthase